MCDKPTCLPKQKYCVPREKHSDKMIVKLSLFLLFTYKPAYYWESRTQQFEEKNSNNKAVTI